SFTLPWPRGAVNRMGVRKPLPYGRGSDQSPERQRGVPCSTESRGQAPYGASSNVPFSRMSCDDAPIHTSNAPGSATQSSFAVLKNDMADLSRVNDTFRASPGLSMTRWKPFNSLSGRSTLDFTSCTYNCTIAAPARAPLLRTCIFTTTSLPAGTFSGITLRPL